MSSFCKTVNGIFEYQKNFSIQKLPTTEIFSIANALPIVSLDQKIKIETYEVQNLKSIVSGNSSYFATCLQYLISCSLISNSPIGPLEAQIDPGS
jgi:hypothetical protein